MIILKNKTKWKNYIFCFSIFSLLWSIIKDREWTRQKGGRGRNSNEEIVCVCLCQLRTAANGQGQYTLLCIQANRVWPEDRGEDSQNTVQPVSLNRRQGTDCEDTELTDLLN